MEWMDVVQALMEDPLARLVVREGGRGIVRRAQRGPRTAAAHSEAEPTIPALICPWSPPPPTAPLAPTQPFA
ncbi:hypothetical protein [Streptomyces sp. NPDC085665]|uniref:hypothetical protein n=1 Tax=Streptomyces sp. NPDC085665 TaxID=3365735 RepID=UPI0037D24494